MAKMLWTESKNPVDALIKLMTGEDCGHFAMFFECAGGGIIFQFNLFGGGPMFAKEFFKDHTVIHSYDVAFTKDEENELFDRWVAAFDGKPYNFSGAIYLGLMKWRQRIFNTPIPLKNKWSKPGSCFCDEAYQLLAGVNGLPWVSPEKNGMYSPHDMWLVIAAFIARADASTG